MNKMDSEDKPAINPKIAWPPDGSETMRVIWINLGINIGFSILALHPTKSVKKIPLLVVTLVFFNIIFLVIWAAKLQLCKSSALKKNAYNEDWSVGQFLLKLIKSSLLLTFSAAIIWCILVVIGFDKWYAFPMSLAFSFVLTELFKKKNKGEQLGQIKGVRHL